MDKLTTERLEEIANLKITEFSDGTDTASGAYQSVGSSEIVLMARQLLAYEQAAEHPAARITWDGSEFSVSNVSEACRDFAEQLAREVEPLSQHEKWLKKQVEMSVAKVNAGEAKFTSNEEVKRVVASRKDEIRAKYKR